MATAREGGGLTKEDDTVTERDYDAEQERASSIEEEISEEIDKEWLGELPLESEGSWRKQTETTNKLLIRVVVLLEGITDHLFQPKRDE